MMKEAHEAHHYSFEDQEEAQKEDVEDSFEDQALEEHSGGQAHEEVIEEQVLEKIHEDSIIA